ncbi:Hypothetical protein BN117_1618 [Bordetella parapertussis Bpp5]|uniref:Uncharacterized protein n=1 Tax=Bordetella parapertussis (strain Bpp5) TaxID=1208660 RepID=K0MG23_BORPB|nr:Hypothetical protein BN117_1618 [Bordetella parapertussis Bpp5]
MVVVGRHARAIRAMPIVAADRGSRQFRAAMAQCTVAPAASEPSQARRSRSARSSSKRSMTVFSDGSSKARLAISWAWFSSFSVSVWIGTRQILHIPTLLPTLLLHEISLLGVFENAARTRGWPRFPAHPPV